VNDGGSKDKSNQKTYRHFMTVTNELSTPKVLVCASDSSKSQVTSWVDFDGNNDHCSYFVGYDAEETVPQSMLSATEILKT
jgi:hypothetical protein